MTSIHKSIYKSYILNNGFTLNHIYTNFREICDIRLNIRAGNNGIYFNNTNFLDYEIAHILEHLIMVSDYETHKLLTSLIIDFNALTIFSDTRYFSIFFYENLDKVVNIVMYSVLNFKLNDIILKKEIKAVISELINNIEKYLMKHINIPKEQSENFLILYKSSLDLADETLLPFIGGYIEDINKVNDINIFNKVYNMSDVNHKIYYIIFRNNINRLLNLNSNPAQYELLKTKLVNFYNRWYKPEYMSLTIRSGMNSKEFESFKTKFENAYFPDIKIKKNPIYYRYIKLKNTSTYYNMSDIIKFNNNNLASFKYDSTIKNPFKYENLTFKILPVETNNTYINSFICKTIRTYFESVAEIDLPPLQNKGLTNKYSVSYMSFYCSFINENIYRIYLLYSDDLNDMVDQHFKSVNESVNSKYIMTASLLNIDRVKRVFEINFYDDFMSYLEMEKRKFKFDCDRQLLDQNTTSCLENGIEPNVTNIKSFEDAYKQIKFDNVFTCSIIIDT